MSNKIVFDRNDYWRLGFHLMPVTGWMNDPNGLCYFKGEYHFFFQYSPDNPHGGKKKWGHYKSRDMIRWEYGGVAITPEFSYEKDGIYSGSALVDGEIMHLFYTGNVKLDGDYNYITDGRQGNTIYANSEDGMSIQNKKCLLQNSDYPAELTCHVRDPKVWMEEQDGQKLYYMVLGARTKADKGEVLIYESVDLLNWNYTGVVTTAEKMGYMWECPDVFSLQEQTILSVSPQGMEAEDLDYQNLYQSGYFMLDGRITDAPELTQLKEWDRGFDFYAPQTFEDKKGRRIMVGWMGMPDVPEHQNPTVEMEWQHAFTVPRKVELKNGKVIQLPVEEIKQLRQEKLSVSQLQSDSCKMYEMLINNKCDNSFSIILNEGLELKYDQEQAVFSINFTGRNGETLGRGRGSRSVRITSCIELQILVDTSAIEIYINGGEEVFTTRFYPEKGASRISYIDECLDVQAWKLQSMQLYVV